MNGEEAQEAEAAAPVLSPAVQQNLKLHPALVEGVQEDPDLLVQMTRAQLAVVQDKMVNMVLTSADATVGQLAAVHERLSKNANLSTSAEGPAFRGAGGPQVVINFIRAPGKEKVVIEAASQAIDVTPA